MFNSLHIGWLRLTHSKGVNIIIKHSFTMMSTYDSSKSMYVTRFPRKNLAPFARSSLSLVLREKQLKPHIVAPVIMHWVLKQLAVLLLGALTPEFTPGLI